MIFVGRRNLISENVLTRKPVEIGIRGGGATVESAPRGIGYRNTVVLAAVALVIASIALVMAVKS